MLRWTKGNVLIRPGEELQQDKKNRRKNKSYSSSYQSYATDTTAFVTKKGSLRIRSIGFDDAGTYSCRGEP